jgi:antitoxin ParD1/3/4
MSKSTSIILNDRWTSFIASRIEAGRYNSASEVIRAGLRMLEIEEEKFENLMVELQKGIDSGPAVPFDIEEIIAEAKGISRLAA